MGEPLSVAASTIAVLQLAKTATQFLKDVRQSAADRIRLRDELRATTCLLEMLNDRIDDSDDSIEHTAIKTLISPDGPLKIFKGVLEEIMRKIKPAGRLERVSQPFTWPFDKKEILELLGCLERLKSHFNLIIQNDLVELAKLSNFKFDNVNKKLDASEARDRNEEAQKVILWINRIQPETGVWFIEHPTFLKWVNGSIDTLWSGSGKTRLVSIIIDHLERQRNIPDTIYTYIYCEYTRCDEQSPTNLLSSLVQQVLQHREDEALSPEVLSLYNLHKKYGTRPTIAQLTNLPQKLKGVFKKFYVIIDALDEFGESEEDFIPFLSALRSIGPQVKVLCTSRHSTTYESYFHFAEKLEILAQSEDIKLYLESRISGHPRLSKHVRGDPKRKEEIVTAIIDESQGMVLLAELQLASLSRKINRKEVRLSLWCLPTTLDATYSEALRRVYSQGAEAADSMDSILFWVIAARRLLTVLELQHMYATQYLLDGDALGPDNLPDSDILTGACGGLIVVVSDSQTVRPVNYTAQSYFERSYPEKLVKAWEAPTLASLAYLTLDNFYTGVCTTDAAMHQRLEEYPFLFYAVMYWESDVEDPEATDIVSGFQRFFSNQTAVEIASHTSNLRSSRYFNWSQEYPRKVPVLVLAAGFNLPSIIHQMIVDDKHDIEGRGTDGEMALIRAAALGQAENVRVLLDLGATLDAHDHISQTALQRAAKNGFNDIVQLLLDKGADANLKTYSEWTPLMPAVLNGNITVVEVLVQAGALLHTDTSWGDTALSITTRNDQEAIAYYLDNKREVLPQNPAGRRASVTASRRNFGQLVRRLTADNDAVAGKPLQRQGSRLLNGLAQVQEIAEDATDTDAAQTETPNPPTEDTDDNFSELVESIGYNLGLSNRYELERTLNKGKKSTVFVCANRVTRVTYAVKVFDLKLLDVNRTDTSLGNLRQEVALLREMQKHLHSNLIGLIDVFAEYSLGKPKNILLTGGNKITVKIIDFDISTNTKSSREFASTLGGTPSYVAPEVLAPDSIGRYDYAVDVWSAGLNTPENPYTLEQQIKMGRFDYPSPYWDPVEDAALDLIDRMITVDPKERFTIPECVKHPWMTGTISAARRGDL
ncbi:NACHT and Ankyrin domain protein [Aspergillus stella-maris]|uniref:NACHT and Ankyrin domain protein n=1 Tax=Aspergillus stella-maris TaxID=1810926 RepID=UPI003CCD0184